MRDREVVTVRVERMSGSCSVIWDIFLVLLAVCFPPLPVWIKAGFCTADSLINIALCVLGYLPGVIHSWYIIAKYPETIEIDLESQSQSGRRIVRHGGDHHAYQSLAQQPNYGSTSNAAPSQGQPNDPPPRYSDSK